MGLAACAPGNQSPIQVATFTPSIPTDTPEPLPTPSPTLAPTLPAPTATPVDKQLGVTIKQLRMLDGPNGWAVGEIAGNPNDLILRTADGGTSWRNFTPQSVLENADSTGMMATAYFLSQYHAWVVYTPRAINPANFFAKVWHTADGGQIWEETDLPLSGMTLDYFLPAEIGFADWQNGWVMAHLGGSMNQDYIAIFITQDGGSSWEAIVNANNNTLPSSGNQRRRYLSQPTHRLGYRKLQRSDTRPLLVAHTRWRRNLAASNRACAHRRTQRSVHQQSECMQCYGA